MSFETFEKTKDPKELVDEWRKSLKKAPPDVAFFHLGGFIGFLGFNGYEIRKKEK